MPTTITIAAGTSLGDSSPLILGGNRNHVDNDYGWRTGPSYRDSVLTAMTGLKTSWGSSAYGSNTFVYRLGHGITDGRTDNAAYTGYHFEDKFGQTGPYPYDDIMYGLDEAVAMGATPLMVVNLATGRGADEAGALASYLNAASDDLRTAYNPDRASSPYAVKYFEIGNETNFNLTRNYQSVAPDESTYAANAAAYAAAIRAASATTVQVGFQACVGQNFTGYVNWGNDPYTITKNVIQNSVVSTVQQADAIVIHQYPQWPLMNDPRQGTIDQKMAMSTWVQARLDEVKRAITDYSAHDMAIWGTEHFSHFYTANDQSFAGALYGLEQQMNAVRNAMPFSVPFTMWHSPGWSGGAWLSDNSLFYEGDPAKKTAWFRFQEIWSQNWGDTIVSATTDAATKTVVGTATTVQMPLIGVCASKTSDALYLLVLNRTPDTDVECELDISGFTVDTAEPVQAYKMKSTGTNWLGSYNEYAVATNIIQPGGGAFPFTAEKASVTLLVIQASGQPAPTPGSAPTVTSFSPESGYAGQSVTLTGTGFKAVPTDNTVSLIGTAATVQSANVEGTSLVVTVPAGADSGAWSVTTDAGTGASSENFTVTGAPPTITSFAPTSGNVGTPVTIAGTGFSETASDNLVQFGGITATVTAATTTSLTTSVPTGALTGNLTLTLGLHTVTAGTFTVVSSSSGGDTPEPTPTPVQDVLESSGKTVNRLREEVMRILDDPRGTHWQHSEVLMYLNEAHRDFCRRTKIGPRTRAACTASTFEPENAFWETPTDFYLLDRVFYDGHPLEPADAREMADKYGDRWFEKTGKPCFYLFDDDSYQTLRLVPYQSEDDTAPTIYYMKTPRGLLDSDEPEIPAMYHQDLVYRAVALAYLKDFDHRDPAKADRFMALYDAAVSQARVDTIKRRITQPRRTRYREPF